jgi:hypothetical protein
MKTMKNLFLFFGFVVLLSFMSCDTLTLGDKLDVNGPVVEFISPKPRKVVQGEFTIQGSARDATSVEKVLLRVSQNREDLPNRWCYENGKWKISEDHGASWEPFDGGTWTGNNKAGTFTLNIDMRVNGEPLDDGEYLFILQAWDRGGFSDDNSIKMLVLIVDSFPPLVEISNPYLYDSNDPDFKDLEGLTGDAWRAPEMIGKFQTRDFLVQWQIDDYHDIWSFDLRFYDYDVEVDGIPETELASNYFYTYTQNVPHPPEPDPQDYIRPNGSVLVPALDGPSGIYTGRGEIKKSLTGKTTVKVVAICYDAAEHSSWTNTSQEKVLGSFIYWPEADAPWIIYTAGMDPLSKHNLNDTASVADTVTNIKRDAFMIYPGRTISANSFHYHGLKEITYSLFLYNETNGNQTQVPAPRLINITENEPRGEMIYSTGFPWSFDPPVQPGIYIIRATPKALDDKPGIVYEAVFRVQDTTFPDFPKPPSPPASEPFFMYLNATNTAFTLSGTVSDAKEIANLCLVWINPQSREFASMAQLEYFRDHSYAGWRQAATLTAGGDYGIENESFANQEGATGEKYPFDPNHRNKLWKLSLLNPRTDEETQRTVYDYSITINLADLNIGLWDEEGERPPAKQDLKSQVFLLRAINPDKRATVITYAPQGDTAVPHISIDEVVVNRGSEERSKVFPIGKPGYDPNQQILKFAAGDQVVITGTWKDDTAEKLPVQEFLFPNMSFTVNGTTFGSGGGAGIDITLDPATGTLAKDRTGTFTITALVGADVGSPNLIKLGQMKDTLVVAAKVKDYGGNETEDTASWLVQTDELNLVRISSEAQDIAYKAGDKIDIFLEFNKPVMLKKGLSAPPTLTLNTTAGTAVFRTDPAQNTENTRQYFTYTVGPNQTTGSGFLDVLNLSNVGANDYTSGTYPFSWVHTPPASPTQEEIRIRVPGATIPDPINTSYMQANLPTGTGGGNAVKSLIANKEIQVDTTAPTLTATGITGTEGWHTVGAQIYITAEFSKPVKIDTTSNNTVPYLTFVGIANTPATGVGVTSRNINDVRVVSGNKISFVYTVQSGDNTSAALVVDNIAGTITDIPGTPFVPGNANTAQKTLTGVYIDTTPPGVPTVSIRTTTTPYPDITNTLGTNTTRTANSGGTGYAGTPGTAPGTIVQLSNVYRDALRLNIAHAGTDANKDYSKIEYSINYGTTWQVYTANTPITWSQANNNPAGPYYVTARQTDMAGNVSQWSTPVVFNWDQGGALVTGINSITPNGTYTAFTGKVGGPDTVEITLNFRKPLAFSSAPSIRLNTNNGAERATNINPTPFTVNTLYSSLTFTYTVGTDHSTNGTDLRVTSFVIPANSVFDGTSTGTTGTSVNVTSSMPTTGIAPLPALPALPTTKHILVDTAALTAGTPAFTTGTVNGDNTYNTTLTVNFNQRLIKGSGEISIIQTAGSYRLPAVLTEAERNRYRTANTEMEALFDQFYTRGTNGLNESTSPATPDTSIKYILNYNENPNDVTPSATGSDIAKLAEAFRQAEKLTFSATSNVVRFENNGGINNSRLVVDISGTTALRVPGGTYEVIIPADFVRNDLSRPSARIPATGTNNLTAGGVARPFIRIRKAQETITEVNTDTSTAKPRIVAAQPLKTTAKIDTRTPMTGTNARMRYSPAERLATTPTGSGGWWDFNVNNFITIPSLNDNDNPSYNTTGQTLAANAEITIGGDANEQYQGYIWRVRARAFTDTTTQSAFSNDAAYRTVFTYQIDGMAAPADGQQRLQVGDQIWLRGGDAIGSSSVPGYPLTWVDDWADLQTTKKRAGIRLMTQEGTATDAAPGTNQGYSEPTGVRYISSARWRWVSWEISVDTVFDVILGRHPNGSPTTAAELAQIKQYGPRQWAYQRAGWTSFKEKYFLRPGNHRWVVTSGNEEGKGALNFSATFSSRATNLTAGWTQP